MNTPFDLLETRAPERRERELTARLPALLAQAKGAAGWNRILDGIDPAAVDNRAALAALPITRKSDLLRLQGAEPPFGALTSTAPGRLRRMFMSPGPIFDPEGHGADWWRFARPMHAAGARPGMLVHNCFSYHFTPAAFMVEGGAAALGCPVVPAGAGQTEMQVAAIASLRPEVYAGTPSFLRIIIERAQATGTDIGCLRRAVLGAEALPESLRAWLRANGVPHVFQTYASADVGNMAYETGQDGVTDPGMLVDEDLILEIVNPETGAPVAEGDIGEVVVTLFNADYPLVRFGTGDLSALLLGAAPTVCGRTNARIKGWMGRADQATKVRAMFVLPSQLEEIGRRHPEIAKMRLVVSGRMANDVMTLHCEVAEPRAGKALAVADSIRAVTKLRGDVQFCARGSLPEDGKLIDDVRDYS